MNRIYLRRTLVAALALGFVAPLLSTTAMAGECPADKVGVDVMQAGATMPKDVTDTVIASIDLGKGYNVDGRLLRTRRHRPRHRRSKRGEKIPPSHSITSSAGASSCGGTDRSAALAVLRLIASSNAVG